MQIFRTLKGPVSCDCRQLLHKMMKCHFKLVRFYFATSSPICKTSSILYSPDGWRYSLICCSNVFVVSLCALSVVQSVEGTPKPQQSGS